MTVFVHRNRICRCQGSFLKDPSRGRFRLAKWIWRKARQITQGQETTTARLQFSFFSWRRRLRSAPLVLVGVLRRMVTATLVFSKPPGAKASEAAKALWSQHLGFAQGRLDVMKAGVGGERLNSAPPLPKLGSPEDPGRMIKDWNFYKYRPHIGQTPGLASSLNKWGPDYRWPGINNTPQIRHHLAIVTRPTPPEELDYRMWTDLPRLDAGPGHTYILKREADARALEALHAQSIQAHIKNVKVKMSQTMMRREELEERAFNEPAFGGSRRSITR